MWGELRGCPIRKGQVVHEYILVQQSWTEHFLDRRGTKVGTHFCFLVFCVCEVIPSTVTHRQSEERICM
ncbi:hypothetical protein AQUCO_00900374v1 [Aquilegia coerulea]|uniref:Uncharacterized protein n=1 Tax=Aquilegia coerulea TaxID=218851 RepID=A0A2G5EDB0_AQUCA|nr:hypothetical protein AQUCO_00900374v1 [Aquilegia coerulea]